MSQKNIIFIDLYIEIDSLSKVNSKSIFDKNEPLHKTFYEYFIENAVSRKKVFPIYANKTIVFEKLIIPNQNSNNLTSEIENYGMEFVREFTRRKYFEKIDYEVINEGILKIKITP